MTGKVTAENAFGQVLICLRMSKLNYIINETPYSAYVTIRKKFVKSVAGDMLERENVEKAATINDTKHVESDICDLKQKLKVLESECGMLHIEKECTEKKYEALEKENHVLKEQFKEAYGRNRDLIKSNEELSQENNDIKHLESDN